MDKFMFPKIVRREFKSQQGLSLTAPEKGQLHWLKDRRSGADIFALVINVDGDLCDVIPGSKEAMRAGPGDIVLPDNVMGDLVMLLLDSQLTVPIDALGIGFAKLDVDVFNDVIESLALFVEGNLDKIHFERGFPYLNEKDERIDYHGKILDEFITLQSGERSARLTSFDTNWQRIEYPEWYKFAAGECGDEIQRSFDILIDDKTVGILTMLINLRNGTVNATMGCITGDVTGDFDGCRLVGDGGANLGTFERGCLEFSSARGFSFTLVDDNRPNARMTLVPITLPPR